VLAPLSPPQPSRSRCLPATAAKRLLPHGRPPTTAEASDALGIDAPVRSHSARTVMTAWKAPSSSSWGSSVAEYDAALAKSD
jgi:hypothetical protein